MGKAELMCACRILKPGSMISMIGEVVLKVLELEEEEQ
jgi:hypothetical protein